MSDATLAEPDHVQLRSPFDHHATPDQRDAILDGFRRQALLHDARLATGACTDFRGAIVLALAKTARGESLIASDRRLTRMHPWRGIPHTLPATFLGERP